MDRKVNLMIQSKKGETLTETLVALLIFALVSVFFVNSVNASHKITNASYAKDKEYQTLVTSAEIGSFAQNGKVSIGTTEIDVNFNTADTENTLRSYRIVNNGTE